MYVFLMVDFQALGHRKETTKILVCNDSETLALFCETRIYIIHRISQLQ
jgi:hypothetical protein